MRKIAFGLALALALCSAPAVGSADIPRVAAGLSQVGQTKLTDLDECQLAYVIQCVSSGGDWFQCQQASASHICPPA